MFFILASLALLVPIVYPQRSKSPLSSSGIEGLMDLSRKYEDDLDWSEDLVNKALEWINSPKKAVKADVKVKGKKCFPKEDEEGPVADFEKITSSFTGPFEKQGKKIAALGAGASYGCNGFVDRKFKAKKCIHVACLFVKPKGN
uniref:SCP domain-containing protein n=1 Tax=Haemonchus contortus TaxID=6289 RepID=A0A7I4YZH9_HAECO